MRWKPSGLKRERKRAVLSRRHARRDRNLSLDNACCLVSIAPSEIRAYCEKAVIPASYNLRWSKRNNARLAETSEEWLTNAYALARVCSVRLTRDERTKAYLHGREIVDEMMSANHCGLYDQYK